MYVAAKLTDGFGNQMFRLAAAIAYAYRWNKAVVFYGEPNTSKDHPNTTLRIRELFPFIPVLVQPEDYTWTTYKEPPNTQWQYTEIPYMEGNVYLTGDFQCWQHVPTVIRSLFAISPDTDLPNTSWNTTAFLHVRRGDYLHPYNRHHNIPVESYIGYSLRMIPFATHVFVVSDDMTWCREALPRLFPEERRWMFAPEGLTDKDTFYWMTKCKAGAITANSSFSWWAAFFAQSEVCCMPSPWALPPLPPGNDIYPPWAIQLNVKN
jgi:hypothetical protein